jgi:hypothetical protein
MVKHIRVVDARSAGWEKKIEEATNTRQNFVVLMSSQTSASLSELLQCDPKYLQNLGKWGIHALHDVLEVNEYQLLLRSERAGDTACFVEQLALPRNRPPLLRPYLVYCEVRGIVSDHDDYAEARSALLQYIEAFRHFRVFPLVGIYDWKNGEWNRVRSL